MRVRHVYACLYASAHVQMRVRESVRVLACLYVHVRVLRTRACSCARVRVCTLACVFVCLHASPYMRVCARVRVV